MNPQLAKDNFGSRSRPNRGDFDHYRQRHRHRRFFESARDDLQCRQPDVGHYRLDRGRAFVARRAL